MKYRKLRIAWSVAWGVVCLLLIVLWVRSYWLSDLFQYVDAKGKALLAQSFGGQIMFSVWSQSLLPKRGLFTLPVSEVPEWPNWTFGFNYSRTQYGTRLTIPNWFAMLLCAIVGAAPWLRWRFSLRTLLIGMTVAAIALGWIVYAIRN